MNTKGPISLDGKQKVKINYRKSFDLSGQVAIVTGGVGILGIEQIGKSTSRF